MYKQQMIENQYHKDLKKIISDFEKEYSLEMVRENLTPLVYSKVLDDHLIQKYTEYLDTTNLSNNQEINNKLHHLVQFRIFYPFINLLNNCGFYAHYRPISDSAPRKNYFEIKPFHKNYELFKTHIFASITRIISDIDKRDSAIILYAYSQYPSIIEDQIWWSSVSFKKKSEAFKSWKKAEVFYQLTNTKRVSAHFKGHEKILTSLAYELQGGIVA